VSYRQDGGLRRHGIQHRFRLQIVDIVQPITRIKRAEHTAAVAHSERYQAACSRNKENAAPRDKCQAMWLIPSRALARHYGVAAYINGNRQRLLLKGLYRSGPRCLSTAKPPEAESEDCTRRFRGRLHRNRRIHRRQGCPS